MEQNENSFRKKEKKKYGGNGKTNKKMKTIKVLPFL